LLAAVWFILANVALGFCQAIQGTGGGRQEAGEQHHQGYGVNFQHGGCAGFDEIFRSDTWFDQSN
jgi:hypothetical protein